MPIGSARYPYFHLGPDRYISISLSSRVSAILFLALPSALAAFYPLRQVFQLSGM